MTFICTGSLWPHTQYTLYCPKTVKTFMMHTEREADFLCTSISASFSALVQFRNPKIYAKQHKRRRRT